MGKATEAQIQYLNELMDFIGSRQNGYTLEKHGDLQHETEQLKLHEAECDETVMQKRIDALRDKVENIFGKPN